MNMEKEFYRLIPTVSKKEIREQYEKALKNGIDKGEIILGICQIHDLIFDQRVIDNCRDISDYMRKIHSFKQYDNKKFKDSIIYLGNNKSNDIPEHYHNPHSNGTLDLISALKNEQQLLLNKMSKAMDEDNIGTYKNLVLALKEITGLVQREEWTEQWSKYSCEGKEYIAVWQQRGLEIKNHRKFEIKNEKYLYVDFGRDITKIYFNNKLTHIKNSSVDFIADTIISILDGDKGVKVCGDFNCYGIALLDTLKSKGFNDICDTDLLILDDKGSIFVNHAKNN